MPETVRAYAYDDANRMTSAGATSFSYDPLGALYDVGAHQLASVGGERLALYTTSGGAMHRRIVPGAAFDEAAAYYHGAGTGTRQWPLGDQLGSVIAYSDAAGEAADINTYDEYGRPGASNAEFLQYTGQLALASAPGLYNYRNRFYQADIGRFMQTDPILYGDGLNLYAYVGNDPLNWADPLGLERCFETAFVNTVIVRFPDGRTLTEQWTSYGQVCIPDNVESPSFPGGGGGGGGYSGSEGNTSSSEPPQCSRLRTEFVNLHQTLLNTRSQVGNISRSRQAVSDITGANTVAQLGGAVRRPERAAVFTRGLWWGWLADIYESATMGSANAMFNDLQSSLEDSLVSKYQEMQRARCN